MVMSMSRPSNPRRTVRRLAADTSGAALVEFAISLPIMLLLFGVIIEGSRMMWDYQSAISGVRDATRYIARVVPNGICSTAASGASLAGYMPAEGDRPAMFPSRVTVDSITPVLDCRAGDGVTYRNDPAPVVVLSATITISFPFRNFLTLAGGSLSDLTTNVTDESRIFGS